MLRLVFSILISVLELAYKWSEEVVTPLCSRPGILNYENDLGIRILVYAQRAENYDVKYNYQPSHMCNPNEFEALLSKGSGLFYYQWKQ